METREFSLMAKKQVLVYIEDADLTQVKRLTGAQKNGTALLKAVLNFLSQSGMSPGTILRSAGGRNDESPAYWAGYNWGKKAFEEQVDIDMWRDGATVDSLPDFEIWADEHLSSKNKYQSAFKSWCHGTANGWIMAGGEIPS